MAKRRNRAQIDADKIIKAKLLALGGIIHAEATATSRRDTGRLQDEQNYRVQPDTTLTMAQLYYGAFNYPDGINSGEKNALLIAIKKHAPETTKLIIKDVTDTLLTSFKKTRE